MNTSNIYWSIVFEFSDILYFCAVRSFLISTFKWGLISEKDIASKMFLVATLNDTVSIAPHHFNEQLSSIVAEEIDRKLANTIFQELGLCICLYDILSMGDCILLPSDANFHIKVKFRYVVFRPYIDEILVGKIRSSSKDGITVSLGT